MQCEVLAVMIQIIHKDEVESHVEKHPTVSVTSHTGKDEISTVGCASELKATDSQYVVDWTKPQTGQ